MNKDRRKELDRAMSLIEAVKDQVEEIATILRTCADEEREYYDNMRENLQNGDKGQQADYAANILDEHATTFEELDFEVVITQIDEAKQ